MRPYNQHTEQVDIWLQSTLEQQRDILHQLRNFILAYDDQIKEYFKYKLPMYSIKKNICYIHIDTKTQKPYIGFLNGKIMQERFPETRPYLFGEKQKRVRQYWLEDKIDTHALDLLLGYGIKLDKIL